MARTVPGPAPGTIVEFVPAVLGNEKDKEPVTVGLREPTEGQRREIEARQLARAIALGDQPSLDDKAAEILAWQADAVHPQFVLWVKNYQGANGQPIADAETLLVHGERDFVNAIAHRVLNKRGLTPDEKKLSSKPSVSLPPATSPSNGTAKSAESKSSVGLADAA